MKYRVFQNEQAATAAEAALSALEGYPKIGVNARTGLPAATKQQTLRWAVPAQIADGRWVFVSPDETGVEPEADWFPPVADDIPGNLPDQAQQGNPLEPGVSSGPS